MIGDLVQIGDAVGRRGIVVAPLFPRRDPVAAYVTLDDALAGGLRICEVDESGTVPELVVENPLADRILPYDGEELVGAKQNRSSLCWPRARTRGQTRGVCPQLAWRAMVAAMSTLTGPVVALAEVSRLAGENVGPWLREYEGYRGALVFADEASQTARLITLWETAEHEQRARASRGAMRDQLARTAGMEVVSFEVFAVVAHEFPPADD